MDYGNKTIIVLEDTKLVDGTMDGNSSSYDSFHNYFVNYQADEFDVSCPSDSSTSILEDSSHELIIEAVRTRPAIWNIRDSLYKDKIIKARLWEEVVNESTHLEINAANIATVRKKWDTVKATYLRAKKRAATGSPGGIKKQHKYTKILSFLDDTAEPRRYNMASRFSFAEFSRSIELGGSVHSDTSESPNISPNEIRKQGVSISRKKIPMTQYQEEAMEMKRRYVEAVEMFTYSHSTSTSSPPASIPDTDSDDIEVDAILLTLKPYLKALRFMARLEAQQDLLKVVSDALKKQGNI